MNKLLVFDPAKQKLVLCGYVDGDTFLRDVNSKIHFMNVVGGYGVQELAFAELAKRNMQNVILKEVDTNLNWYSKFSDWTEHGKVADYGHGKQRFLSKKYMVVVQK